MGGFPVSVERNMRIFSEAQCYELMHHMEMLDHIARHSLQVCRVAMFLATELRRL
jgi:hypothetical protein